MAAALYRQGREWVSELAPAWVWDLYCGVGGFALHCAAPSREVTRIETSSDAIASARISSNEAGLEGMDFHAGDATAFALAADQSPELVIVNPPRRGIGKELCGWLESSDVEHGLIPLSCDPVLHPKSQLPFRASISPMIRAPSGKAPGFVPE